MTTEWKTCYAFSRDYTRLKSLLDDGYEVICLVDYDFWRYGKHPMTRDVCMARKFVAENDKYTHYSFNARGTGYFDIYPSIDKFTFTEACEARNIEFIDKTKD